MNASDFKCATCKTEQADYFYPIWDLDQETKPKPYCKKCLRDAQIKLYMELFNLDEQRGKMWKTEGPGSDENMVSLIAANVMGWRWSIERTPCGGDMWFVDSQNTKPRGFDPFHSEADNALVLDKLSQGPDTLQLCSDGEEWWINWNNDRDEGWQVQHKDRKRCVCLAAFKSAGGSP